MARIRTVKPEFFKHYDLFKAEQETKLPLRLAFSGLWVVADKEGRFKYLPPQLKLDVLPYDDVDFEAVLIALDKYGFIEIYEVEGKKYAHIPTFTEHQRITGTERDTESKIPCKQQGNTLETLKKQKGNKSDDRKGREGKGKEKERKGEEYAPPDEILGLVIFDIEKEILNNPIVFEQICVKTGKDPTTAKNVLRKYHLWLVEKEQYPKGKKAGFAGFEKWLMNEKKYVNGTTHRNGSQSATSGGLDPTRIATEGAGQL